MELKKIKMNKLFPNQEVYNHPKAPFRGLGVVLINQSFLQPLCLRNLPDWHMPAGLSRRPGFYLLV